MLSYAGANLDQPSPDLLAWARQHLSYEWLCAQGHLSWPGPRLLRLWLPRLLPIGPVVPGRLYWPWGATRFAQCYCVATQAQLDAVRHQCYAAGGYAAQAFVLDDGTRQLTTQLYLLPPLPLSQCLALNQAGGLWLLPLLDDRYFWWQQAGVVPVVPGTTAWADLWAGLGAALGVTIAADPVPAAYLGPPAELGGYYEALPILADSTAASCGQRVVRGLDGSVRALNATSALAIHAQNLALAPRTAGGQLALSTGA